jgi:hypothetical protein
MAMNFNTGPYFDDFDPENHFYRVLFKPGYAVQARELNQLQSILQHQVSSVGKHLFKKNAMVIPGGIALHTTADIVSISGVEDPSTLVGQTITNAGAFDPTDDSTLDGYITAVVLASRDATDTAPPAIYVKYFKTQTDGRGVFVQSEALKTVNPSGSVTSFSVDSTIGATIGKVASLNEGTFFTKDIFVDASSQSVIVEVDGSNVTNCTLGLSVTESVVTSDEDESLLDNANGSPNQYAPGADRYKIELTLVRLDANSTIDDDNFIKMMQIENDTITYINNKTEYAELMKTLARRTYDANGNFIVRGLETSISDAPDSDYIWATVSRGKCYLGGYEYEQLNNVPVAITKARDEAHQVTAPPVASYTTGLPYFFVAGADQLKEIPSTNSLVQFLDAAPDTVGVSVIGYGVVKDLQYAFGSPGVDDIYRMYFEDVTLEKGYSIDNIGGIKLPVAAQGAPVLHEMRIYNIVGTFTPGNNIVDATGGTDTGLIYAVFDDYLYAIKDTLNAIPTSDVVLDSTTSASAARRSTFITSYDTSFVPMIEVDAVPIKTMYTDQGIAGFQNTTSYSVVRRDQFNVTTAGSYSFVDSPLTGSDIFEDFSTSDYFAYIVGTETFVELTSNNITIAGDGKSYTLDVGAGSPMLNNTVYVYATVNRENVQEADKVLNSETAGYVIPTPSASWMPLLYQDVVSLDKVVEGRVVNVTNAVWAGGTATLSLEYTKADGAANYYHNVNDVVVIRGVNSVNNATAAYDAGFNGKFTLASVGAASESAPDSDNIVTVTLDVTYALAADPGAYNTSDSTISLEPDPTSDLDITSRYELDSGVTAYAIGTGMIKLRKGVTAPRGQISVLYSYYTMQTGGYVSVDSYGDYTSDLGYIGEIPDVVDNLGNTIDTRRYLDFRTRTSHYFFKNIASIVSGTNKIILKDLNLSGRGGHLEGKYVVGPSHLGGGYIPVGGVTYNDATGNTEILLNDPNNIGNALNATADYNGIYYIGLFGTDLNLVDTSAEGMTFALPRENSRMTYQYTKFTKKNVLLYIDRQTDDLTIKYMELDSLGDAYKYRRDEFKLPLVYLEMKPYTLDISDVTPFRFENPVYHMLDIHNLKNRIDRNEYYSSLALSGLDAALIAGAEELTTASYGFWNENFADPSVQDYSSPDFACTVYDKSYASPGVVTSTVNLQLDTSLNTSTWAQTGTTVTLPYTETVAFSNTRASRSNNLNPFNTVQWEGKMTLSPSVDNWIDTTTPMVASVSTSTAPVMNEVAPVPVIPTPVVPTAPAVLLPAPPVEEIVVEVNVIKAAWGPDTAGGRHSITFEWKTSTGRTGRVNTDHHLSKALKEIEIVQKSKNELKFDNNGRTKVHKHTLGKSGTDGTYAKSLINRSYNDEDVKAYLNAGRQFDQKSPSEWRKK